MKLLITGAYGLVGSNICKLIERDYPEIEVTKVKLDIFELPPLPSQYFDFIINAAGYGQPQLFTKNKIETIMLNVVRTNYLFPHLALNGKFLYVSSSEIYSGSPSPNKETDIGTTSPQHPRACYIEGKRCGEAICMAYKEQGYDIKIARLALAYGPGTKKGDTRVLNQFIEQALTTGEIKMRDDGSAMRTYGYVEDVAYQLLGILFKGNEVVYNVGGISRTSIKELAETIGLITGAKVIAGEKSLEGAPDDVNLDLTKVMTEFPRLFIPLEEGLKKTIEYQKELYEK